MLSRLFIIVLLIALYGCSPTKPNTIRVDISYSQVKRDDYISSTPDTLDWGTFYIYITFSERISGFTLEDCILTNLAADDYQTYPFEDRWPATGFTLEVKATTPNAAEYSIEILPGAIFNEDKETNDGAYRSFLIEPIELNPNLIPYDSLIGDSLYADEAYMSVIGDPLMNWSHVVEKWKFYRDSIIVIATRYDAGTMQALEQYKYIGERVGLIDRIWVDSDDNVQVSTAMIWKTYNLVAGTCNWTQTWSFSSPTVHMIFYLHRGSTIGIGIGTVEINGCLPLEPKPLELWYPNWWFGHTCGFVQ